MMRLRPRKSNENENLNIATSKTQTRGTKRAVLGDVSNKRKSPIEEESTAKKTKANAKSTRNIAAELEENQAKRRRSSTRLQQKEKSEATSDALPTLTSKVESSKDSKPKPIQQRAKRASPRLRANEKNQEESKPIELIQARDTILELAQFKLRRPDVKGFLTAGLAPFDVENKDNELQVATYITDICQHLYKKEHEYSPRPYMHMQADINGKMRAILVDWLVEVHMKFRLVPETLYLCVNIIDRYCSTKPVKRAHLQLVGVTALLVACKYEEIYPPEVRDCVYITDRAYSRKQVLDMEQDILKTLNFKVTVPTAHPFLVRFLHIAKASEFTRSAATYYLERTLQEHDMLKFAPSLVCASAVVLALNNPDLYQKERKCSTKVVLPGIPQALIDYTSFEKKELIECAECIAKHVAQEPVTASRRQLIAVKRKFDNKKYNFVSGNVDNPNPKDLIEAASDC